MKSQVTAKASLLSVPLCLLVLLAIVLTGIYSQSGTYKLAASLICATLTLLLGNQILLSLGLRVLSFFFSSFQKKQNV